MKEEMNNQGRTIRFKIVEKSGVSLEQKRRENQTHGEEKDVAGRIVFNAEQMKVATAGERV